MFRASTRARTSPPNGHSAPALPGGSAVPIHKRPGPAQKLSPQIYSDLLRPALARGWRESRNPLRELGISQMFRRCRPPDPPERSKWRCADALEVEQPLEPTAAIRAYAGATAAVFLFLCVEVPG